MWDRYSEDQKRETKPQNAAGRMCIFINGKKRGTREAREEDPQSLVRQYGRQGG